MMELPRNAIRSGLPWRGMFLDIVESLLQDAKEISSSTGARRWLIRAMLYFTFNFVRDCSSLQKLRDAAASPNSSRSLGRRLCAMRRFLPAPGRAAGCIARGSPGGGFSDTTPSSTLRSLIFAEAIELIDAVMQFARHAQTLRFLRLNDCRGNAASLLRRVCVCDIVPHQ